MTTGVRLCSESSSSGASASSPRDLCRGLPRCHITIGGVTSTALEADRRARPEAGTTRLNRRVRRPMTTITHTTRTHVRELEVADAAFINDLLNQPAFLRYIGDRNVRTVADAATFIETRYRQSYRDHGYGLYVVESRDTAEPMGICGFVRRDTLPAADMGFAYLPEFEGRGIAFEAAAAILSYGESHLGLTEVLAIVQEDNARSHALLRRLGFRHRGSTLMPGETAPLSLFMRDARSAGDPSPAPVT
jgi:[ribosomal protein S5]-alanine N-acetyltransferase